LPKKEWCYLPNKKGAYAEGMQLAPDYLRRTGYRLPTEAEWEYACRAGAATSRYYGSSEELLPRYAWFMGNSKDRANQLRTWPVGEKRPNDLGLFDMHGNVWTWCQEKPNNYPRGRLNADTELDIREIRGGYGRIVRGGSFYDHPRRVRSATRGSVTASFRGIYYGLRVARTYH
jgi:formylglycine-generating enzyme required for sulfatase activity